MSLIKNNYSIEPDHIKWSDSVIKKFGGWPSFDTADLMDIAINIPCNNIVLVFESFLTKGEYSEKEKAWYHGDAGCWQLKLTCEGIGNFEWKKEDKDKNKKTISQHKDKIKILFQTKRYGTIKFDCEEIFVSGFKELRTKKLWRLTPEGIKNLEKNNSQ